MKISFSALIASIFVMAGISGLYYLVYEVDDAAPEATQQLMQTPTAEDPYPALANDRRGIERLLVRAENDNHAAKHDLRTLYLRFGDNALVRSFRHEAFKIIWQDIEKSASGLAAEKRHAETVLKDLFTACESGAFDARDCVVLYKPS